MLATQTQIGDLDYSIFPVNNANGSYKVLTVLPLVKVALPVSVMCVVISTVLVVAGSTEKKLKKLGNM